MSIDTLGDLISAAVKAVGESSERSVQSSEGRIGPSDLGFCRQKALLMMRNVPQSDSSDIWKAQAGVAIHDYLRNALAQFFPDWTLDSAKVTATFPSGYTVTGTPDLVVPEYNIVIDHKTTDGFERVKKLGRTQSHRFQLATYALGCIQSGLLDGSQPVFMGNLYWDRSGRENEPLFMWEQYDPSLIDEVDEWIGDVVRANLSGEDTNRDIEPILCRRICSHFTACRGHLPTSEEPELITAPELVAAAELVFDGRSLQRVGRSQEDEGKDSLSGIDGVTDRFQIRHVEVNRKSGSFTRLDVTER